MRERDNYRTGRVESEHVAPTYDDLTRDSDKPRARGLLKITLGMSDQNDLISQSMMHKILDPAENSAQKPPDIQITFFDPTINNPSSNLSK